MGSFNTTCFVSNQTIATGDKCSIFPIKQSSGYNPVKISGDQEHVVATASNSSTCYPDCFWKPVGSMISGVYDDYGRIEVDTTENNQIAISKFNDYLKDTAYSTEEGENKSHDVPFSPSIEEHMGWDYMWNAVVNESRVFVPGYNGNSPSQLSFAIVSKFAYDYLISSIEKQKDWDGNSLSRPDFIGRLVKAIAETKLSSSQKSEFMLKYEIQELLLDSLRHSHGGFLGFDVYGMSDHILKNGVDSEMIEKIGQDLSYKYFFLEMENLNLKIQPMVYASQDYDNSVGKDYAKLVRYVSSSIAKSRKLLDLEYSYQKD